MAVNCFGSGVARLSVHASMHTTHSWLLNEKEKRTLHPCRFFFLSPQVAEHPRTEISRPSCCLFIHGQKRSCFSSRKTSIVCPFPHWVGLFPHAQEFSWFPTATASWEPCVFTHEFPEKSHSRPQLYVLLTDRYGCVISVILMLRLELLFFPPCLLFSWDCVIRLLGVVLATRGPRTTQKSFSLFKLW